VAKDRAVRRAQRERAVAARAQLRAVEAARAARRQRWRARLRRLRPRPQRRPESGSDRRRRAQNRAFAGAFGAVQVVGWLIVRSGAFSIGLLIFTALTGPVLLKLMFDRR
jgi:Flp pilus assembly protein TadB